MAVVAYDSGLHRLLRRLLARAVTFCLPDSDLFPKVKVTLQLNKDVPNLLCACYSVRIADSGRPIPDDGQVMGELFWHALRDGAGLLVDGAVHVCTTALDESHIRCYRVHSPQPDAVVGSGVRAAAGGTSAAADAAAAAVAATSQRKRKAAGAAASAAVAVDRLPAGVKPGVGAGASFSGSDVTVVLHPAIDPAQVADALHEALRLIALTAPPIGLALRVVHDMPPPTTPMMAHQSAETPGTGTDQEEQQQQQQVQAPHVVRMAFGPPPLPLGLSAGQRLLHGAAATFGDAFGAAPPPALQRMLFGHAGEADQHPAAVAAAAAAAAAPAPAAPAGAWVEEVEQQEGDGVNDVNTGGMVLALGASGAMADDGGATAQGSARAGWTAYAAIVVRPDGDGDDDGDNDLDARDSGGSGSGSGEGFLEEEAAPAAGASRQQQQQHTNSQQGGSQAHKGGGGGHGYDDDIGGSCDVPVWLLVNHAPPADAHPGLARAVATCPGWDACGVLLSRGSGVGSGSGGGIARRSTRKLSAAAVAAAAAEYGADGAMLLRLAPPPHSDALAARMAGVVVHLVSDVHTETATGRPAALAPTTEARLIKGALAAALGDLKRQAPGQLLSKSERRLGHALPSLAAAVAGIVLRSANPAFVQDMCELAGCDDAAEVEGSVLSALDANVRGEWQRRQQRQGGAGRRSAAMTTTS